jgi:hypothetical protein
MTKIAGSGSISQRHGSTDPDPPQNVMDPQHRQGDAQAAGAQPQDCRLHPSARARSRRRSQVIFKGIVSFKFFTVLCIRNPVLFLNPESGSGISFFWIPDPQPIFDSLLTIFAVRGVEVR